VDIKWIGYDHGTKWMRQPAQEIKPVLDRLRVGVYEPDYLQEGAVLTQIAEKLSLPTEVYGMERGFIDRVLKSWKGTDGNLGVLLTGLTGAGKTVTGKVLATESGLPVVVVNYLANWVVDLLASIPDDVVVFLDEVEKVADRSKHEGEIMLPLMDGIMGGGRKLFILTCNEPKLAEYFFNRPKRIRYVKRFDRLPGQMLTGIVDHELKEKEFREEALEWLRTVEGLSVDIAKEVVREINLHRQGPREFEGVFNVIKEVKKDVRDNGGERLSGHKG
jgi:hypothetical protein